MRSLSSMTDLSNMSKLADTITENLPTREDLLNAVGLMSRRSTSGELATVISVFGAGILIGAGLALLFAPKTGEEMRRDLGERFSSKDGDTEASRFNRGGEASASGASASAGL